MAEKFSVEQNVQIKSLRVDSSPNFTRSSDILCEIMSPEVRYLEILPSYQMPALLDLQSRGKRRNIVPSCQGI